MGQSEAAVRDLDQACNTLLVYMRKNDETLPKEIKEAIAHVLGFVSLAKSTVKCFQLLLDAAKQFSEKNL